VRSKSSGAVKEAIIILAIGIVVGILTNALRKDGIPLIADAEAFRIKTRAEFVKVEDAYRLFENGEATFIDARDERFFLTEHIEGSMSLPATGGDITEIAWLAASDPIVICYASAESQRQAGVLADRLLASGFNRVYVLLGGLEAWKEKGYPTARDDA